MFELTVVSLLALTVVSLFYIGAKMTALQDGIDDLKLKAARLVTASDAAEVVLAGIGALIAKAVADALAKGATEEQLAAIKDVADTVDKEASDLANAVAANTPSA